MYYHFKCIVFWNWPIFDECFCKILMFNASIFGCILGTTFCHYDAKVNMWMRASFRIVLYHLKIISSCFLWKYFLIMIYFYFNQNGQVLMVYFSNSQISVSLVLILRKTGQAAIGQFIFRTNRTSGDWLG